MRSGWRREGGKGGKGGKDGKGILTPGLSPHRKRGGRVELDGMGMDGA